MPGGAVVILTAIDSDRLFIMAVIGNGKHVRVYAVGAVVILEADMTPTGFSSWQ